jgi:hypothetical protein
MWIRRTIYKVALRVSLASLAVAVLGYGRSISIAEAATSPEANAYSWRQVTAAAPWSPRGGNIAVAFHNKIWVIGGGDISDVWSSVDGASWTQETANAPWAARSGSAAIVFGDKIWLLGGGGSTQFLLNDVWRSSDGVQWEQVTDNAPWSARYNFGVSVFQGQLYLAGGFLDMNDVWSSPEGTSWTRIAEHAPWPGREGNQAVFLDRLWVLGGMASEPYTYDGNYFFDCWSTGDGTAWVENNPDAGWSREATTGSVAVFDGKLWLLGGGATYGIDQYAYTVFVNEVRNSTDGVTWSQAPNAPWTPRMFHGTVVFNNALWILGGFSRSGSASSGLVNDVWSLTPVSLSITPGHASRYAIGETMTLTVTPQGLPGQVSYQWLKDGAPLSGETTDTYHVDGVNWGDAGVYTCRVSGDTFGATSPFSVTVSAGANMPVCGGIGVMCAILGIGLAARRGMRQEWAGIRVAPRMTATTRRRIGKSN